MFFLKFFDKFGVKHSQATLLCSHPSICGSSITITAQFIKSDKVREKLFQF